MTGFIELFTTSLATLSLTFSSIVSTPIEYINVEDVEENLLDEYNNEEEFEIIIEEEEDIYEYSYDYVDINNNYWEYDNNDDEEYITYEYSYDYVDLDIDDDYWEYDNNNDDDDEEDDEEEYDEIDYYLDHLDEYEHYYDYDEDGNEVLHIFINGEEYTFVFCCTAEAIRIDDLEDNWIVDYFN